MAVVIEYSSDEQLQQLHREAIHVLGNLRYWTKEWEGNYGYLCKTNKKRWEQKADELLAKYNLSHMHLKEQIKITKASTDENKTMQPVQRTETA